MGFCFLSYGYSLSCPGTNCHTSQIPLVTACGLGVSPTGPSLSWPAAGLGRGGGFSDPLSFPQVHRHCRAAPFGQQTISRPEREATRGEERQTCFPLNLLLIAKEVDPTRPPIWEEEVMFVQKASTLLTTLQTTLWEW